MRYGAPENLYYPFGHPKHKYKRPKYKKESHPSWIFSDKGKDIFYVYLLKLNNGSYYAGQTNDIEKRLSQHKKNLTKSTKDKEPELVMYREVESRNSAVEIEVEWKKLIDKNTKKIEEMINEFNKKIKLINPN